MNKQHAEKILLVLLLVGMLFLTGCSEPQPTDKEIYARGWLIHNIDENTPTTLEAPQDEHGEYRFEQNLPGGSPEKYASILWFASPFQFGVGATHVQMVAPFVQTLYTYTDNPVSENFDRNWGIERMAYISYIVSEDDSTKFVSDNAGQERILESIWEAPYPNNQENITFSFGGPYVPGSFTLQDSEYGVMVLLRNKLIQGKGGSFLAKGTEARARELFSGEETEINLKKPLCEIYLDGVLTEQMEVVDYYGEWDERELVWGIGDEEGHKHVFVNLTIPTYYPVYENIMVTSEFYSNSSEIILPWLEELEVAPGFAQGEELEVQMKVKDTDSSRGVKAFFKSQVSGWQEINLSADVTDSKKWSGRFVASGENIDMRIDLQEEQGNNQSYFIFPISLAEDQPVMELHQDKETISPGTSVRFYGQIRESSGVGINGLLIRAVYNGEEITSTFTTRPYFHYDTGERVEGGNFSFVLDVPLDYTEGNNLSLFYGGAGKYIRREEVITGFSQIFDKDVAIVDLATEPALYAGSNTLGVKVVNVGKTESTFNVKVYVDEGSVSSGRYYFQNDPELQETRELTLAPEQISDEVFEIQTGEAEVVNVTVVAELDGDMNLGNNYQQVIKRVYAHVDAEVDIEVEHRLVIGEGETATLEIYNRGTDDIYDLNYTLKYGDPTESESKDINWTLIEEGTIERVQIRELVTQEVGVRIDEVGHYYLRAEVSAEGDGYPGNNIKDEWVDVQYPGADLRGELNDENNLLAGESNEVVIWIYNKGNENSENGSVALYYQEGYCILEPKPGSGDDPCDSLVLIEEREIVVSPFVESIQEEFSFTPQSTGDYTFVTILNASNEINPGNNVRVSHRVAVVNGADIRGWMHLDDRVVPGTSETIEVYIENRGTEAAEQGFVELYYKEGQHFEWEWDNLIFIGRRDFELGPGNETREYFQFTPYNTGEHTLVAFFNASNEVYQENNFNYQFVEVFPEGADLSVWTGLDDGLWIIGETYELETQVFNEGEDETVGGSIAVYSQEGTCTYRPGNELPKIQISDCEGLQDIQNDLGGRYVLTDDISCEGFEFEPIGTQGAQFEGLLIGQDKEITGLQIDLASEDEVGLFRYLSNKSIIREVHLKGVDMRGRDNVAGIAGVSSGKIEGCSVAGNVVGTGNVGGIVGWNYHGTVYGGYFNGTLQGGSGGGIAGISKNGVVEKSYVEAEIVGGEEVGGVVGYNERTRAGGYPTGGVVRDCYSKGSVTGSEGVGGLVGQNDDGEIWNCYSSADVVGKDWEGEVMGGLVGKNDGEIFNSFATGAVLRGEENLGGLVGENEWNRLDHGTLTNCAYLDHAENPAKCVGYKGEYCEEDCEEKSECPECWSELECEVQTESEYFVSLENPPQNSWDARIWTEEGETRYPELHYFHGGASEECIDLELVESRDKELRSYQSIYEIFEIQCPTDFGEYIFVTLASADNEVDWSDNFEQRHVLVQPRGADLQTGLWSQDGSDLMLVGEIKELVVAVENNGNQESENANISLYYYQGYFEPNWSLDDFEIIETRAIGVDSGEYIEEVFEFVPPSLGDYVLLAVVNASNEINPKDNLELEDLWAEQAGADLSGWIETEGNLLRGNSNNLTARIRNYGNQITQNGRVSVYYQKGYCESGECDNLTLVMQKSIELQSGEDIDEVFEFIPQESGEYTLVMMLNASNEIFPEDNTYHRNWVNVVEPGPNVRIWSAWEDQEKLMLVSGQKSDVTWTLENVGTQDADTLLVSMYIANESHGEEDAEWQLVASKMITRIDEGEQVKVNLSFTPSTAGELSIMGNVSLDGDIYVDDNQYWFFEKVLTDGLDVGIGGWLRMSRLVVNETNRVHFDVENTGTEVASNVSVYGYLNGELIGEQVIEEVGTEDPYAQVAFELTPETAGEANLTLAVNVPGDVNPVNDVYQISVQVHSIFEFILNLTDSLGGNVTRFILDQTQDMRAVTDTSVIVRVLEDETEFGIANLLNYSGGDPGNSGGFIGTLFYPENISEHEALISEYYDRIEQNGSEYFLVFANIPSFQVNRTEFSGFLRGDYAESIGMDVENIHDYSVFYCTNFSFSEQECVTEWLEPDTIYIEYEEEWGEGGLDMNGKMLDNVEAIAISKIVSGFSGDSTTFHDPRAKIEFQQPVDTSQIESNRSRLEAVVIETGKISIDTERLPELAGIPAEIEMRNIDFHNPQVLYNGGECPESVCENSVYDPDGKLFYLRITGFSEFFIVEGEYCGDGDCQSSAGETCSNCEADCGECDPHDPHGDEDDDDPPPRRQSPSGGTPSNCTALWNCTWGACSVGSQRLICVDERSCGNDRGKPSDVRACLIEGNCTDSDDDGYGEGPDCVGWDYDDNDPAITDSPRDPITLSPEDDYSKIWIYILYGIALVVVIGAIVVLVIILIKKWKKKEVAGGKFTRARKLVEEARERGYNKPRIKEMFFKKGWKPSQIKKILK